MAASLHEKSDLPNSEREGKKDNKTKQKKKKKKRKKEKIIITTCSLPSLRERSQTSGALDRRALGITGDTRCPATVFRLRSALPVTGVLTVGRGRRESILYAGAEPAIRLLGRQHSDPSLQANEPSQLPAKTGFKFNI